jgi:hypothetical protein
VLAVPAALARAQPEQILNYVVDLRLEAGGPCWSASGIA